MTRFEALRPAGLTAYYSLTVAAAIAVLVWVLYCEAWIGVDEFRGGILAALFLLAGGCIAAVATAVVALALRDRDGS